MQQGSIIPGQQTQTWRCLGEPQGTCEANDGAIVPPFEARCGVLSVEVLSLDSWLTEPLISIARFLEVHAVTSKRSGQCCLTSESGFKSAASFTKAHLVVSGWRRTSVTDRKDRGARVDQDAPEQVKMSNRDFSCSVIRHQHYRE